MAVGLSSIVILVSLFCVADLYGEIGSLQEALVDEMEQFKV